MSGPFGAGALQYFSGEKNFYPHTLDQSLTFTKGNGSFLERKPSTAGNTRVWAWSGWIKKNVSNVSGGGNLIFGMRGMPQATTQEFTFMAEQALLLIK